MILLGIALPLVGLFVAAVHVLFYVGIALLVVGLLLALLGNHRPPVAGRRYWFQLVRQLM